MKNFEKLWPLPQEKVEMTPLTDPSIIFDMLQVLTSSLPPARVIFTLSLVNHLLSQYL